MKILPKKDKGINVDVSISLDILLKKLEALDEIRESQERIESKLDMILDRGSMDRTDDIRVTFRRG